MVARALRRPVVAIVVLLAAYVALSFLNDPRGQLGSDSGSKVATLQVMAEHGRLDPDVGYWAERFDPAGRVHPLIFTVPVDGRWVNVTTLPMLYAAYPLYRLGGYRLALALPMLGGVFSALAARALVRRLSSGAGWSAFWLVGLASPVAVYSLDLWEHSLGLAAMAWAVVLLYDVTEQRRGWAAAAGAGGLLGAAAALRTEALAYGAVAVAASCLVILIGRRRTARALGAGAAATVGMALCLGANVALEVTTVGGVIRSRRTIGLVEGATSASADLVWLRAREAAAGAFGLFPSLGLGPLLLGLLLTFFLAYAVFRLPRPGGTGPALLAGAAAVAAYALCFVTGAPVVPGLLITTPLAVVGVVLGWSKGAARYPLAVGVVALPVVWATQYPGSATSFFGGRYVLLSGLLLGTAGIACLPRLPVWGRWAAVSLALAVTGFGLAGMSVLTHGFARAGTELARRPEPVVVSRVPQLARVVGSTYGDRRWLTALTDADQRFALGVLDGAGVRSFALVVDAGEAVPDLAGWRETGLDVVAVPLYSEVRIVTYERD